MNLLKKQIKQLLAFAVLPPLLIVLVGSIYSRVFIEEIPFGITDLDNTSLSRNIEHQFRIHPGLKITLYTDSEAELEKAIRDKKVSGGVVIPQGFYRDMRLMKSPKVLLLVDGSNLFIGNTAQGYANTIMATVSAGLQVRSLSARGMLPSQVKTTVSSFSFTERILFDPTLSFLKYQIHVLFLFLIQTIFFAGYLIPRLVEARQEFRQAGRRSAGSRQAILELAIGIGSSIVVLCLSTYAGLWAAELVYRIPFGGFWEHCALMSVFLVDLTAMAFFAASLTNDSGKVVMVYVILGSALVISAGVTWPAYMMPPGVATFLQLVWPMFNVTYPFKALHLKDLGWEVLLPRVLQGVAFAAAWGALGLFLYRRSVLKTSKTKSVEMAE